MSPPLHAQTARCFYRAELLANLVIAEEIRKDPITYADVILGYAIRLACLPHARARILTRELIPRRKAGRERNTST